MYTGSGAAPVVAKIAKEKGISVNKCSNMLLENAIYKLFEEEVEYGKIEFEQVDSK